MAVRKPQPKERRVLTVNSVLQALFDENASDCDASAFSSPESNISSGFSAEEGEDSAPLRKRSKKNPLQSSSSRNESVLVDRDHSSEESEIADDMIDDLHYIDHQSEAYTSFTQSATTGEEDIDLQAITSWMENGCACCRDKFTQEEILSFQLSIRELTKEERDMYLFGKLHVCMVRGKKVKDGHQRASLDRERTTFRYAFDGDRSLCKSAFLFIHDITEHTLKSLSKFIRSENGCPTVQTHKSKYKPAKNAHSFETIKTAVTYLKNMSTQHGLPQPAAPRGKGEDAPVYLPSSFTKVGIHAEYMEDCERMSVHFMRRSSFVTLGKSVMPNLKIMTPRTDVCRMCEVLRHAVMTCAFEDEKLLQTKRFQDHIEDAANEREVYTTNARQAVVSIQQSGENSPSFGHYTFDFAQQLQIPHHYRQEGPEYFVVPRRIQLFGDFSSGSSQQVNYLVDENETIGSNGTRSHGPNSVISMLDHYLAHHGKCEPVLSFHADNCAGQNKNKSAIAYFAWRILHQKNTEINLSFMVVGHTRCAVDGCFGLIKKCYRRTDCECLSQIAQVVSKSAICNVPQLYNTENGWKWYEWDQFLEQYFKPIPGIRKFRHFRFSSEFPGSVFVKQMSNGPEQQIDILRCPSDEIPANYPPIVHPAGLTKERQLYLYNKIRPFIRDPSCKDLTCPSPN